VVELGLEAVAAVDTGNAVERWRVSELKRKRNLHRDASAPSLQLAQVFPVVQHAA
jgi:hypothetical protein